MTPDHHAALTYLLQHDRPFFANYRDRNLFAWLVMAGLAECYVIRGGEERVRISAKGRELYGQLSTNAAQMPRVQVPV